jgi:hypothetical protein
MSEDDLTPECAGLVAPAALIAQIMEEEMARKEKGAAHRVRSVGSPSDNAGPGPAAALRR